MKKHLILSAIAGSFLVLAAQNVFADNDNVQNASLKMTKVLQSLQNKGYLVIEKVSFSDGQYNATVRTKQGKEIKVSLDPKTGTISKELKTADQMTILEAAQKAEAAGYHNIYKIKYEGGKYSIKALDQNDKKVKVEVDANSGKIEKDWF